MHWCKRPVIIIIENTIYHYYIFVKMPLPETVFINNGEIYTNCIQTNAKDLNVPCQNNANKITIKDFPFYLEKTWRNLVW